MLIINTESILTNLKSEVNRLHDENCSYLNKNKWKEFVYITIFCASMFLLACGLMEIDSKTIFGALCACVAGIAFLYVENKHSSLNEKKEMAERVESYLKCENYIASAYEYELIPFSYLLNKDVFEIKTKDVLSYGVGIEENRHWLYIKTENKEYKIRLDEFRFVPNSENEMRLELIDKKIVLTNI